jgi:hypothetical protein
VIAGSDGEHPFIPLFSRLFDRQTNQAFGRQGDIPMLLKQIHVLAGIEVGSVDLLLPGRSVGQGNQFDGFNAHGIVLLRLDVSIILRPGQSPRNPEIGEEYPPVSASQTM